MRSFLSFEGLIEQNNDSWKRSAKNNIASVLCLVFVNFHTMVTQMYPTNQNQRFILFPPTLGFKLPSWTCSLFLFISSSFMFFIYSFSNFVQFIPLILGSHFRMDTPDIISYSSIIMALLRRICQVIVYKFDVPKSFSDFICQCGTVFDSINNSWLYILQFSNFLLFIYKFFFLYMLSLLSLLQLDGQFLIIVIAIHCYQYMKKKGLIWLGARVIPAHDLLFWLLWACDEPTFQGRTIIVQNHQPYDTK